LELSENMIIVGLVVLIAVLVAMRMMKKRNAMKKQKMPQLFDNEAVNDGAETESVVSSKRSSRKSELPGYTVESHGYPLQ
jgi:FtsZ-interacting cell division protein ZipA